MVRSVSRAARSPRSGGSSGRSGSGAGSRSLPNRARAAAREVVVEPAGRAPPQPSRPFGGVALLGRLAHRPAGDPAPTVQGDGDHDVGARGGDGRNGHRVQQPAVDQHATVEDDGRDDRRDRGRGPDGDAERAFLEPDLALGEQVDGHGGVVDVEVLDLLVVEELVDDPEDPLAADRARPGERHVHQPQDLELTEPDGPLPELVEPPGGVESADEGPHRRAGDRDHADPGLLQHVEHADVGVAARPAAAEHQGGGGPRTPVGDGLGGRVHGRGHVLDVRIGVVLTASV